MSVSNLFFIIFFAFCSIYACKQQVDNKQNNSIELYLPLSEVNANKATVLFFLSPTCPLCIDYALTISELQKEFQSEKINMKGIFSGSDHTEEEKQTYLQTYQPLIPIINDTANLFVKKYKATITPEVIVINQNGNIVYRGAIDNWVMELGRRKPKATKFYLKDAIRSILEEKNIAVSETNPIGCLIE